MASRYHMEVPIFFHFLIFLAEGVRKDYGFSHSYEFN